MKKLRALLASLAKRVLPSLSRLTGAPTHPLPGDLESTKPIFANHSAVCFRLHSKTLGPLYFNPTADYRFNAPCGEYGVCYIGTDFDCSFVETMIRNESHRYLTKSFAEKKNVSTIVLNRDLKLFDLTGPGLSRIGATAELCSMSDYSIPQQWSKAIFEHSSKPDGILYPARHDPSKISIALFGRPQTIAALEVQSTFGLLSPMYFEHFKAKLVDYGFTYDDDTIPIIL